MDQYCVSIKTENVSNLPLEEHYIRSNVKTELDQAGDSDSVPFNIIDTIKTEVIDINEDDEVLELQEATEEPSLKALQQKCSGDNPIQFIEKKYFTCPSCSYKTRYKYNLIRHVKTHGKQRPANLIYKCDKCPFESDQNAALQRHYKVHSDTYYKCTQCDFVTKYKESLPKHYLTHKSPSECEMYSCDECEYETKQKLSLKRHMLIHRRLEEVEHFKCPYCKFVTKHQLSINNHVLKIHKKDKIEKHKCPECDFSTYHKISLKGHRLTHRKPGEVPMYKCPECPYETKNKSFLPNHMKCHKETVPCPKCQKLITQRGMPLHLKSHESGDAKNRYKCTKCPYATLYYGNLSRHMKIMHSNKEDINYKLCPECPFKTFENARLKRHIKEIHSTEAPQFKCGECEFTSKFNSCLKRHVETAHGDKHPETCPVCFKPSANIYTLRIHMKLHRSEDEIKMFRCGDCPYKTRHSGAYKDHVLRHKSPDEVPLYTCTNCSFKTKIRSYLLDHIAKYCDKLQLENKVCCPSCCFKTSSTNNLRIHMSKVHRDEMDPNLFWHCTLCPFKTLNKRVLKDHLRGHNHMDTEETEDNNSTSLSICETNVKQEWDVSNAEKKEQETNFFEGSNSCFTENSVS